MLQVFNKTQGDVTIYGDLSSVDFLAFLSEVRIKPHTRVFLASFFFPMRVADFQNDESIVAVDERFSIGAEERGEKNIGCIFACRFRNFIYCASS
ncbi:MAG: hypothetical protein D6765_13055 [Bacteroidetes bacterium]|nr:MAG: hypothetical protein D6765_13055 [Bacteroidota bacterium]